MNEPDKITWKAFREGDRNAFESLMRAYYKPLFDYGYKFLKDRERLKDCIHDLLVDLWDRRSFLSDVNNLKVYLFTALRNQIRREQKQASYLEDFPEEWDDHEPDMDTDAEQRIIEQETDQEKMAHVQRTISRLSRRQQEILHLKYHENLSNEQIADVLTITRPAVANLLYQALRSFRQQWGLLFLVLYIFLSRL